MLHALEDQCVVAEWGVGVEGGAKLFVVVFGCFISHTIDSLFLNRCRDKRLILI